MGGDRAPDGPAPRAGPLGHRHQPPVARSGRADIAAGRFEAMFEAAGWHCVETKYGSILRELFARPGGDGLRRRIDTMSNEEYQRSYAPIPPS